MFSIINFVEISKHFNCFQISFFWKDLPHEAHPDDCQGREVASEKQGHQGRQEFEHDVHNHREPMLGERSNPNIRKSVVGEGREDEQADGRDEKCEGQGVQPPVFVVPLAQPEGGHEPAQVQGEIQQPPEQCLPRELDLPGRRDTSRHGGHDN